MANWWCSMFDLSPTTWPQHSNDSFLSLRKRTIHYWYYFIFQLFLFSNVKYIFGVVLGAMGFGMKSMLFDDGKFQLIASIVR